MRSTPQSIVTSYSGGRRGKKQPTVTVADVKSPSALTGDNVYAFVLARGPHTGRVTTLKLKDPDAIAANGGRRLAIKNYRFETADKAIADDLTRQIAKGEVRGITREMTVWVNCPATTADGKPCGFRFKSNDAKALSEHFMAAHVSIAEDVPEDDPEDEDAP